MPTSNPPTYASSGVNLEIYQESMRRLPALMHRTYSPRVLPSDGGFAGLFQLDFDCELFARKYKQPVLVSGTDGVGTKLKVASLADKHNTVGIDLVAMCVNDILCTGAEPLFFLDYVAMGEDDPERLEQIVTGISDGCVAADCALLGGETAIMPDLYAKGDYDLAGFCVGVVEKKQQINGSHVTPGDMLIGIASNGLHSNGFSLVRKVVFEIGGLKIDDQVPELGGSVADELLKPTHIYTTAVKKVLQHYKVKNVVHAIAHITGGGLVENLTRVLPKGVKPEIEEDSWTQPAVFPWLQQLGGVEPAEMARVFNMGIGMVLVVSDYYHRNVQAILQDCGYQSWVIGKIAEA